LRSSAKTTDTSSLCSADVDGLPEGSDRASAFAAHLLDVIAHHELDAFFVSYFEQLE
jgi:hypothetical protein